MKTKKVRPSIEARSEQTQERNYQEVCEMNGAMLAALRAVIAWADRECMPQGGKSDGPWEQVEAAIARCGKQGPALIDNAGN